MQGCYILPLLIKHHPWCLSLRSIHFQTGIQNLLASCPLFHLLASCPLSLRILGDGLISKKPSFSYKPWSNVTLSLYLLVHWVYHINPKVYYEFIGFKIHQVYNINLLGVQLLQSLGTINFNFQELFLKKKLGRKGS